MPPSSKRPDGRDGAPGAPGKFSTVRKTAKPRENTVAGCQELAASDLVRASGMDTRNGRRKFELSAASWQQRADLLKRLETSFEKRRALDVAEWQRADAAGRLVASQDVGREGRA